MTIDSLLLGLPYLLPTINDALLLSPVLVQAYGFEKEPSIAFIPFPFEEETLIDLNVKETTEQQLVKLPVVQKIYSTLNLQHTFGFIKMLNSGKKIIKIHGYH